MDIRAKLATLASAPKYWRVTTLYTDGSAKTHDSHSLAGAENFAIGERRKIGRDLIDRATGNTVRVVDVYVARIED